MRSRAFVLATAAATVCALDAQALDVGLSLTQESEYTTNSGRTQRDEVEEWIHSPGAALIANHAGPNLNMDVNYRINRRIYEEDLYDDENEAAGSANPKGWRPSS